MRFISQYAAFAIQIMAGAKEYLPGGIEREIQPTLNVQFMIGDVTHDDVSFAEKTFAFHGRNLEMDEVTPVSILGRVSVFDTNSTSAQAHFDEVDSFMQGKEIPGTRGEIWKRGTAQAMTEAKLTARAEMGDAFKVLEEIKVAAPWPTYNDFRGSIADLVERVVQDGYALEDVLAYERQNLNRADVTASFEQRLAETAKEPEEAFVT